MMNELEWPHFFIYFHYGCGESSIIILIHGRDGFLQLLSGSFRWVNYSSSARNPSFITVFVSMVMLHVSFHISHWSDWFQERFKPESPIFHHISCENPDVSHIFHDFHGKIMENPMVSGFHFPNLAPSFPVRVKSDGRRWTCAGSRRVARSRRPATSAAADFSRWISWWFFHGGGYGGFMVKKKRGLWWLIIR